MLSPRLAYAAAGIVGLEAVGLLAVAGMELAGALSDGAAEVSTGIALIVLTLIGAAALASFAWGIARGQSWARSGAIVLQLLALALVLASLMLRPVPWAFTITAGVPAVLALGLLIASARAEGREARTSAVDSD